MKPSDVGQQVCQGSTRTPWVLQTQHGRQAVSLLLPPGACLPSINLWMQPLQGASPRGLHRCGGMSASC